MKQPPLPALNLLVFLYLLTIQLSTFAQFSKEIGEPLNNPGFNEFSPCLSIDGAHFVFVSDKDGKMKFFESTKGADGKWSAPQPIDEINNFGNPNAIITSPVYNYDASVLYFDANFKSDSSGVDIYYSKKIKGIWQKPVAMPAPINSKGYDGQPSVSSDDATIYFVRENPKPENDDFTCYKIYSSQKGTDGKWEEPKLLPVPINLDCEKSPRICADNQTLFLSSVRAGGKGDFDLYYAKQIAKNVWIVPIKIDTLNTTFSDAYPTLSPAENFIYYSISRTVKKKISSGIYQMDIPKEFKPGNVAQIRGKIIDLVLQKPVAAKITVTDPNTSIIIAEYKNNPVDGSYNITLTADKIYKLDVFSEGFSHFYFNYSTEQLKENTVTTKNVLLFSKVTLKLNVFDREILQPQAASISIFDAITGKQLDIKIDQLFAGRFNIILPIGIKYRIEVRKQHFEPYTMLFDLGGVVQFDEFERDLELTPVKRKLEINVTDDVSKKGLPVDLLITNIAKNEKFTSTVTADKNGKYILELREGEKYEINVSPKGYSFYNTSLDLSEDSVKETLDIRLTPLTSQAKIMLNDITFETNSADLNASSFTELDRVLKLMNDNPDIKIEISAHTDDVGTDQYNLKLSDKRAQSVVNYLKDKNIAIERMIAKGYGESKPILPNTSDENRAKNRRVELKIIEVKQQ